MPKDFEKKTKDHTISLQKLSKAWLMEKVGHSKQIGRRTGKSSIIAYGLTRLRLAFSTEIAKGGFPRYIAKDNSEVVSVSLDKELWSWVEARVKELQSLGIKGVTKSSFIDYSISCLRSGFKRSDLYKIPERAILQKTKRKSKTLPFKKNVGRTETPDLSGIQEAILHEARDFVITMEEMLEEIKGNSKPERDHVAERVILQRLYGGSVALDGILSSVALRRAFPELKKLSKRNTQAEESICKQLGLSESIAPLAKS